MKRISRSVAMCLLYRGDLQKRKGENIKIPDLAIDVSGILLVK